MIKTFKPEFEAKILSGAKTQTIRPWPKGFVKRFPKIGDTLSLRIWTGRPYHSKQRVIFDAPIANVQPFHICSEGFFYVGDHVELFTMLNKLQSEQLAMADGFDATDQTTATEHMLSFFKKHYHPPFKGLLIEWDYNKKQTNV